MTKIINVVVCLQEDMIIWLDMKDHEAKRLKRKDFLKTTCLSLYKNNLFAKNGKQFLQS